MTSGHLFEPSANPSHPAWEPALLTGLEINSLFGRYNYGLTVPSQAVAQRLVLFYGENGTGKTTVLRLIWHLLSPSHDRGHRNALRQIPFRSMRLDLSDGAHLIVEKAHGLVGPFTIKLTLPDGSVSTSEWGTDNSTHPFDDWETHALREQLEHLPEEFRRIAQGALDRRMYLSYLEELGVKPYYLADDRNIYGDQLEEDARTRPEASRRRATQRVANPDEFMGLVAQELETSMRRAGEMLQQLALGGATSGSASANSVYAEVLQRLSRTAEEDVADPDQTRTRLIVELRRVGDRSSAFEELGLVPRLATEAFMPSLESIPSDRIGIADEVLAPYLSSLSARLDALQDAQTLIRTFLDEANGFLTDKRLVFDPRRGLRIQLNEEEWLTATQLSSGERQLILLLCNALLARRGTRLFLVDEPELSLNAKWQRKIIPALLACTEGAPVQFLVATHSIEILSGYRSNIVRLEDPDASA